MVKTRFKVICSKCNNQEGIVEEVEARPGIFVNNSTPSPLPRRCTQCFGTLRREDVA